MKRVFVILLFAIYITGVGQTKRQASRVNQNNTTSQNTNTTGSSAYAGAVNNGQPAPTTQTATDRYLNGPVRTSHGGESSPSSNTIVTSGPFAGGVHAAENAAKTFDTVSANRNNANNQTTNTIIRGRNDTTFNINTTMFQGGITTNSGAVDRSGQAQFGQTNWGTSRSTVGESQWTVPPPITASFNKEFPSLNNATWTRNNVDTTIYSARYKSGAQWVTTNYNSSGRRLDMRTQFPLVQPPTAVSVYMAKQPANFTASAIYKLQVQGRLDLYEIELPSGKKIYINNDGMEVNY